MSAYIHTFLAILIKADKYLVWAQNETVASDHGWVCFDQIANREVNVVL